MQVLSSLSSLPFYAPSAGYAPTNDADVSAIASAYQVVSATATQLNAGTAYLTSVNETPISAARAGNAANASLATSAWYDGTGRMISALPDESTVSSIASAYAESAASSKLDESASSSFYPTSNPSGFISGVDLSDYATTAYVDSSVSSKLDTTAQVVTSVDTATSDVEGYTYTWVNGINGTSISAMTADVATRARTATYDSEGRRLTALAASSSLANYQTTANMSGYVPFSAISADENSAITSINGSSIGGGGGVDSATVSAIASAYADPKLDISAIECTTASAITAIGGSAIAGGGGAQVVTSITTGGYGVNAINGMNINASHMKFGAEAANNNSNVVKLGNSDYGAGVFLTGSFGSAYYKVNELQLNRNGIGFIGFNIGGAGSQITATSNAGGKFSAGGTGGNRSYFTAFNASASASIEVTSDSAMINIADTGYTSTIYPSSIPYWNGKLDTSAIECDTASAITAIGGSAIAGGGGGVDSATVSAIASSYAESATSGKQDSSAMTAYVEKTAYDNLYSAFTALSDIISTYSGYFSSISAKVDNSAIGVE